MCLLSIGAAAPCASATAASQRQRARRPPTPARRRSTCIVDCDSGPCRNPGRDLHAHVSFPFARLPLLRARHRVRVQLLGDVRLDRAEPRRRQGDAGEGEHFLRDHDVPLARDRIAERDIDAERLTVEFARELALGAKPKRVALHSAPLDRGVVVVRADLEGPEVAERAAHARRGRQAWRNMRCTRAGSTSERPWSDRAVWCANTRTGSDQRQAVAGPSSALGLRPAPCTQRGFGAVACTPRLRGRHGQEPLGPLRATFAHAPRRRHCTAQASHGRCPRAIAGGSWTAASTRRCKSASATSGCVRRRPPRRADLRAPAACRSCAGTSLRDCRLRQTRSAPHRRRARRAARRR